MPFARLPDTFPVLRIKGYSLREIGTGDAEAWFANLSDPAAIRYTSTDIRTLEQARELVRYFEDAFRRKDAIRWALSGPDGSMAGDLGFNELHERDRRGTIGYQLSRGLWGRGLMSAAVGEIVRYGFEELDLNKIEADVNVENERSAALLRRLGFQVEGRLRDHRNRRGEFGDSWHFGLLRREWQTE